MIIPYRFTARKVLWHNKMYKFPLNGNINDVQLRLIVLNINTAAYNLAKFLSKLLAPLRESE